MAEFTPEYIALMRDLRLARELKPGDWLWFAGEQESVGPPWGAGIYCWPTPSVEDVIGEMPLQHGDSGWLPLEGDWLRMLEEAGIGVVELERREGQYYLAAAEKAWDCEWSCTADLGAEAPTRLEALARLWMAVTGRGA